MFASTSLARKRLTSAPALKNFSLALRTTTTRDVASAVRLADRVGELEHELDVVGVGGRVVERDRADAPSAA